MEIEKYMQGLLQRILKIEPENAIKIFGYLLLHRSIEEIVEYVTGTEDQIHSLIAEAKSYFMVSPKFKFPDHLHRHYSHTISLPFSAHSSIRAPALNQFAVNHQSPFQNSDLFPPNGSRVMEEQLYPSRLISFDSGVGLGSRSHLLPGCNYFCKGYCNHGQSFKSFHHDHANPDSFNAMFGIEDLIFSAGSLEEFEIEITELLRARRGVPVSLSSLPSLYQEMYGKSLLPDGYLTESQRHGKVSLSLMKIIAQLRNIRLVDRCFISYFLYLCLAKCLNLLFLKTHFLYIL